MKDSYSDSLCEFKWPERKEFWENLKQYPNVEEIYINGGEPTLIKQHWKFLEDLIREDKAKNISLWYSVNMTRMPDKIEMWNVFNQVLRRLAERITYGEIHDETVTVAERMEYIIELLKTTPEFLFSELFTNRDYNLTFLIATFLAILELARMRTIEINQEMAFTDIRCRLNPEN